MIRLVALGKSYPPSIHCLPLCISLFFFFVTNLAPSFLSQLKRIYSPEKNANPPLPSDDALKVDPPNVDRPFQRLRSAMYAGLHTNLPKTVMCYRDFNFGKDVPFFPSHDDVLTYLQQFAAAFELEPLIRLNTSVVRADYANDEWTLTLQTPDQKTFIDTFDAVVVATGHYAIPYIPPVEGIEALDNVPWIHSREYRNPEDYKDQVKIKGGKE